MHLKYSIIFFFLALAYEAAGQQLPEGTFIYSTGFTYEAFTFKRNHIFEYKFSSCTGGQEGIGTYTFKKRQLLLTFENPKNKPIQQTPSQIRQSTQNDTSYLAFKFFDQRDTTPIAGVIVKFTNKSDGSIYATHSNSAGQATLKMKSADFPLNLEVSYIGVQTKSIRVDTSGNYSIFFPISFEFLKPLVSGDRLQFIIDSFDNDEIVLKQLEGKKFRTFRRKKEE